MAQASVFKSNRSQAIRLPKQMALPEDVRKVEIYRSGRALVIVPAGRRWDDFFDAAPVSDDFMSERTQPVIQERDAL
jgi:antitoxin VapB